MYNYMCTYVIKLYFISISIDLKYTYANKYILKKYFTTNNLVISSMHCIKCSS